MMKCMNKRDLPSTHGCYSPTACAAFGYCRERNSLYGMPREEVKKQWQDEDKMSVDDENTSHWLYGHRTNSAWYSRNCHYYDNNDGAWQFLGYKKPTAFYLQCEYLEIKT